MLKSRAVRLLLWLLLALGLLWLAAWLALPPLLKWQLETRGSELLGRELRVGEVHFAPTKLALTLRELSIGAAEGAADAAPQLRIARLFIDLDARSLLRWAPVVEALEIDAPRLRLARLAEGRTDIDDLRQRFAPQPGQPPGEPARFALFNLRLSDGEFLLDDRPVGRSHALRKIVLDLPFLSNLPDDLLVKVEPRLAFEFNGSAFDNHGRSTPFAAGRASELTIRFDRLALQPLWAYLPAGLPLLPDGGLLSADLVLRFEQPDQGEPHIDLRGKVALDDLRVQPPGAAPLLSWQSLRLQLAELSLRQRQVVLDEVRLDGAVLHLQRDADGALQLQRLLAARPAAPAAAEPAAPWQLKLASLQLDGARVHWADAAVQPAAEATLDGIALQLQSLSWPMQADATLRLAAQLQAQGRPAGRLQAEGAFTDRQARIDWQLGELDLGLAEPYLRAMLRPQVRAKIDAAGSLDWAGGDTPRLLLALPTARIDALRLADPASPAKPMAQWTRLELTDLRADVLQRRLAIGTLSLQRPELALARDGQGRIDAVGWWQAPAAQTPTEPDPRPPWQLQLRELKVDGGRLRFADAALPSSGPLQLDGVRVLAQDLVWPLASPAAPLTTQVSAVLSVPGVREGSVAASRLDWRGRVRPQPLAADGQLLLERFPVHVFEPYFGAALPVELQRLEAGFKGRVDLKQGPAGLAGQLRGDALLADLRLLARAPGDADSRELLTWNAVSIGNFGLTLQPDAKPLLEITELRISDYYSRVEVTEEGRFNLQNVAAAPAAGAAPASAPAPAAGAAAAPAPAASAAELSAPSAMLSRLPIDLVVNSTRFDNGRVDFRDRFIRPNYSAQLSELNGTVGRLDSRSRDMATLQFGGRVAGTGLLEIGGAINPTVIPPALDIKAKAHDIELPGLTPYSSKYAGYPIERGKLSVDVAYKIEADGKLEASNQIIVNQLTFGARTDSPDATKLPVPFLVALLQDRHGVIDLDLPLTGSINDPQFSMGALIWKVVVNFFGKLASSPFSVIGGGGKDLSHVDFQPGTASITPSSQEIVAKVAKALDDRPALKLGVVAMADPVAEREALQRAAFEARVLDEQRRERARAGLGSAGNEAPLPPLTGEQRERLVRRIYDDTRLPDKPRNVIGLVKDIPMAEMEAMLLAVMPADAAAARQLAVQRGLSVRDALMAKGLGSERIFLGEPKLRGEAADNAPWVPQAQLALSAN